MNEINKIKIIHNNDHELKLIGELLSNDTSRKIIKLLISQESYTNEIATKLDIRVSLVIHHLKKLEELGILEITEKRIAKKGNLHRHFKMIPGLFVMPNETKEEVEEKGTLKKIFKEGIKFVAIAMVGSFVWLTDLANFNKSKEVYPVPFGTVTHSDSLILALSVIIIGLIIERIFSYIKKKSGG